MAFSNFVILFSVIGTINFTILTLQMDVSCVINHEKAIQSFILKPSQKKNIYIYIYLHLKGSHTNLQLNPYPNT